MNDNERICVICGKIFAEIGHDPLPFVGDRCCDDCYRIMVVPARLKQKELMNVAAMRFVKSNKLIATYDLIHEMRGVLGRPDYLRYSVICFLHHKHYGLVAQAYGSCDSDEIVRRCGLDDPRMYDNLMLHKAKLKARTAAVRQIMAKVEYLEREKV